MGNLRWLHLSDFHTGKDEYGQIKLFQYILKHINERKEAGWKPDVIFITGDIANKGAESEYRLFEEEFFMPLIEIFPELPPIYLVPGNHDLDRNKAPLAAGSLYSVPEKNECFFDTNSAGQSQRSEIFGRFSGFQNAFEDNFCFPVTDIFTEKGCFWDVLEKDGKRIGIVGLNTAWLSNSDKDMEKLTPGKQIVEEALEAIKDCSYRFVLGHHPLSWFQIKQRQQITALLAKKQAIYLHGHMHTNSGEYALCADKGFLTLQSGAAFQARESELYYNSLLWGELDVLSNRVSLTPRKWSAREQSFILDSSESLPHEFREEGTDHWVLPIAFSIPKGEIKQDKRTETRVPVGWTVMNQAFINKKRQEAPCEEDILRFFDGKEPSYSDIFSNLIPIREMACEIKNEFIASSEDNRTKCALITGAAGEGKSTMLLQVVRLLVEENSWSGLILRQPEKNMQLSEEQLLQITQNGNWVIAVDNCTLIIDKLYSLLTKVSKRGRTNVHFLLCTRDIDWNNSKACQFQWGSISSYTSYRLRGIHDEDAKRIVAAWAKLGDRGLGKLKDMNTEEAKKKLLLASQDEEIRDKEEGALLGAMLATRYGDDLHNHVREMLLRLKSVALNSETLLEAFAYIVAMHSEKLYFLSKTVLAKLYNCELKKIKKEIIGPLGDEAACAVSGDMIYTRHLSIAESARRILDKEFHFDFDEIFIELATAAIEARQAGEYVEALGKWRFLSDHFKGKNENGLAIRLDKAILKLDPTDTHTIVHLSKLYRAAGQPDLALDLFRGIDYVIEDRPFFCEWALVEANEGNKAASVCLSAVALSDQAEKRPIDVRNASINLYSIAYTFLALYSQYKKDSYKAAARAAAALGLRISKEDKNLKELVQTNSELLHLESQEKDEKTLYQRFQKGILTAAAEREISFKTWIPEAEALSHKRLFAMAGITL